MSACACERAPHTPREQYVAVTRPGGSWQGVGSRTIGFNSDSGRFRVTWETRNPGGGSSFRLTVHSAVSGRPIKEIAHLSGAGRGVVDVDDDPRPYNFIVESANVEWSFSVDEVLPSPVTRTP